MRPPAGEAASPVSDDEAGRLFGSLTKFDRVALAVSGGSDSTALLWLAARWTMSAPDAPALSVLTVNHGLRRAAAAEARAVTRLAGGLGLPSAILAWRGSKPDTGIQAAAREARYRLMTAWCSRHGVPALLTAHTLDDQAETFLMRLARGSGLDGLAAIGEGRRDGVRILRPLLGVSRERLRATLRAAGVDWLEDPSNEDTRFERVRIRCVLARLEREGLSAAAIARSAERLARARIALDAAADELFRRAVTFGGQGKASIDRLAYEQAPEELRIRVLQAVLAQIGGETPELSAIERLAGWVGEGRGKARTLGGCRVARGSDRIGVTREAPRRRH